MEEEGFGHLKTPPIESSPQTKAPAPVHKTSSASNFTIGDDNNEGVSAGQQGHNTNVLHDYTNTERPWTASSNKGSESGKQHISYDNLDGERNPWSH